LSLPRVRGKSNLRGLAILAMPNDTAVRCPTLHLGEEEAIHLQQEPLLLADFHPLMKQHGNVMEIAQLRWTRHTFQAVEGQRDVVIFQCGVKEKGCSPLQAGRGEGNITLDLSLGMPGEDRVDSLPPDRVSRPSED